MKRRKGEPILLLSYHGRPCPYCSVIMRVNVTARGKKRKDKFQPDNVPTQDHVIPKRLQLGSHRLIVCRKCNYDKRDLTLKEWHSKLKSIEDPRAPYVKKVMESNQWNV